MKLNAHLVLLAAGLSLMDATLYVVQKNGTKMALDTRSGYDGSKSSLTLQILEDTLHKLGFSLRDIRFDMASGSTDVLSLPEEFFSSVTKEQILELLANPNTNKLFSSKGGVCSVRVQTANGVAVKKGIPKGNSKKLQSLKSRLATLLTPRTLSSTKVANKVVKLLPSSAYSQVSPLLLLTSPSFKPSYRNIARVFGISLRSVNGRAPDLVPYVADLLEEAQRLCSDSNSSIYNIVQLILNNAAETPELLEWIGSRLEVLLKELGQLDEEIVNKYNEVNRRYLDYRKNRPVTAKQPLLIGSNNQGGNSQKSTQPTNIPNANSSSDEVVIIHPPSSQHGTWTIPRGPLTSEGKISKCPHHRHHSKNKKKKKSSSRRRNRWN